MTDFSRHRFRDICKGNRAGDFGVLEALNTPWPETLSSWVAAGGPASLIAPPTRVGCDVCSQLEEYFQFDKCRLLSEIHSGVDSGISMQTDFHGSTLTFKNFAFLVSPPYEPEMLEEDDQSIVFRSRSGIIERLLKDKPSNMPRFVQHPVSNRRTWNIFKRRLDPNTAERYPDNWETYVRGINHLDCPVGMEVGGFFGYLNMWVGTENLMYMFYDDPILIEDMMDTVLHLEMEMFKRVSRDIKLDYVSYWEDMAYRSGPMIGPDMVRKFMVPRYQSLNKVVTEAGCDIFMLDSDGNIDKLIPLWLETGINFFLPVEIAAGMDPIALRKKYGKNVILGGGLDKRVFSCDKSSIRDEVLGKVPMLSESGPYFPAMDHDVPLDVPFENFCYYINLLREVRGDEALDFATSRV